MSKTACPAGCGKRFISAEHARAHADSEHPERNEPKEDKRKGWITPSGFGDFKEPVTYAEACESMQVISELLAHRKSARGEQP